MSQGKTINGNVFLNPVIIIKKDPVKLVLVARHPISNTNQSAEPWTLEPLETQLVCVNKSINLQLILCTICTCYIS